MDSKTATNMETPDVNDTFSDDNSQILKINDYNISDAK